MKRMQVTIAVALSLSAAAALMAQSKPVVAKSAKVGVGLYEIAVDEKAGSVYVASAGRQGTETPKIYVLDAKTLAVKNSIDLGTTAAYGLGINTKTQTLYTSNTAAGTVSVIDLKTNKIVATIGDPALPDAHLRAVTVDDETNLVYVTIANDPGKIWVIDGKTNKMLSTIEKVGKNPIGVTIDRAAKRLYAASMSDHEIIVIDATSREVIGHYPSGGQRPMSTVLDAKSGSMYVVNQGSGDVTVLEPKSGKVLTTIKTGAAALSLALNPSNGRLYVANRNAGTVTVIDTATNVVVADLQAGTMPNTVVVTPQGAYVTNKAKSAPRGSKEPPTADPGGDTVTLIQ